MSKTNIQKKRMEEMQEKTLCNFNQDEPFTILKECANQIKSIAGNAGTNGNSKAMENRIKTILSGQVPKTYLDTNH